MFYYQHSRKAITIGFFLLLTSISTPFISNIWARRIRNSDIEFLTIEEIQQRTVALLTELHQIAGEIKTLIQEIQEKVQAGVTEEEMQPEFEELNRLYIQEIYRIGVRYKYLRFLLSIEDPTQRSKIDRFLAEISRKFDCDKCFLLITTPYLSAHFYPYGLSSLEFEQVLSDPNKYLHTLNSGETLYQYGIGSVIYTSQRFKDLGFTLRIFGLREEGKDDFTDEERQRFSQILNSENIPEILNIISESVERRMFLDMYMHTCSHAIGFPVDLPSTISRHKVNMEDLESVKEVTEDIEMVSNMFIEIFSHPLQPEVFNPIEVIEKVIALHRKQVERKGLKIFTDLYSQMPDFNWQKGLMELIIDELLRNAIKYTQKGSITVSLRPAEDGSFQLQVKDTGVGIPQEELEKIFKYGYRGSNVRDISGTGEGLSLISIIIRSIGGKIDVESEINTGTTVTIRIPQEIVKH